MSQNSTPRILHSSKDYVERYANTANLTATTSDFRMDFAFLREPENPGEAPTIDVHTTIFMSPQQSKMFIMLFTQHLRNYEIQYGEIKVMPGAPLIQPAASLPPNPKLS